MLVKLVGWLTVAAVVFLIGGGVSFTSFLVNGLSLNDVNPRQTSITAGAIGLYSLGAVGLGLVGLSGKNSKRDRKLARRQMLVGFGILFTVWAGLELLSGLTV